MSGPVILLLAAGASSRMRGADKLLEPVGGVALLRRQAQAALESGAPVVVALPPGNAQRHSALQGLGVTDLTVPQAALGMGHSIAAGAELALERGAPGMMVLNADLPGIGTPELAKMLAAAWGAPDRILRGMSAEGEAGHPVVFPARLLPELAQLTGDSGARSLVAREAVILVPLPGDAATRDLDTPEEWQAWRAETGL